MSIQTRITVNAERDLSAQKYLGDAIVGFNPVHPPILKDRFCPMTYDAVD